MSDHFTDLPDLTRDDRDARVTVKGDRVTVAIRGPRKFMAVVVDRARLTEAITSD